MARLLSQSVATVRDLASAGISKARGTFPGSTTFPGGGSGSAEYPGATTYPGAAIFPGGGRYLYPGWGGSIAAAAISPRNLTETTA